MANTYTDQLRLTKQGQGENEATWGVLLNTVIDLIEESVSGLVSVDLSSGSVTLSTSDGSTDQARHAMVKAYGTLTANREIIIPAKTKSYIVWNTTSGSYTVTVKTSAGSDEEVPLGELRVACCDGTNVLVLGDSGTSAATPSTLMARDTAGRSKIVAPSASTDVANKAYVDAVIPSGSRMLFYQAAAPTGWTQMTSANDRVIRVVSGAGGGYGGSWTISGLTNSNVGSHAVSINEMPSHNHAVPLYNGGGIAATDLLFANSPAVLYRGTGYVNGTGGGAGHTHSGSSIASSGSWRPQYIDVIAATKN